MGLTTFGALARVYVTTPGRTRADPIPARAPSRADDRTVSWAANSDCGMPLTTISALHLKHDPSIEADLSGLMTAFSFSLAMSITALLHE
jgi:hypothetical protein